MTSSFIALTIALSFSAPGEWPEPRQNDHLTSYQPLPGNMTEAPEVRATVDLGRSRPAISAAMNSRGETTGLAIVNGALHAYAIDGSLIWRSHPPGINFESIQAVRDLNGDTRPEILLQAGRSAMPFGTAILVGVDSGDVLWRYDVDPMSYAWYLYAGDYRSDIPGEEIIVMMHGYPPDKENGFIALFAYETENPVPRIEWRYDFHEYTCFPSLLQVDHDNDGVNEICVQTHSRMWIIDPKNGNVDQFLKWDVSPGNVRSYGFIQFVDLDGDADEDFLCIADFSQHHEVLLNNDGIYEKAWHYGWGESVTTGKVVSTWPEPPYADLDGDGRLEVVVSMYNADNESKWKIRVYDAIDGMLRAKHEGAIAVALHDSDGDGAAEILANLGVNPSPSVTNGAALFDFNDGAFDTLWKNDKAKASPKPGAPFAAHIDGRTQSVTLSSKKRVALSDWAPPPPQTAPDFSAVPSVVGPKPPEMIAANLLGDAKLELVTFGSGAARIYKLVNGSFQEANQFPATCLPAIADLNGDGSNELVIADFQNASSQQLTAYTPATNENVWSINLPPNPDAGIPRPRPAYIRTGNFTGADTPDIYLWTAKFGARSMVINGQNGEIVWEHNVIPESERFWGPSVNVASVYDYNEDGADDLVFTNPDYYCIASGRDGALIAGPRFPPDIFSQPSQGLYTLPAILERDDGDWVALASGHYFQAAMSIDSSTPLWYRLPIPGEARSGSEAFLQLDNGRWRMGFGRQDGTFMCIDVITGNEAWSLDLSATASDVVACNIDGTGPPEFILGDSHGHLTAITDRGDSGEILWTKQFDSAVNAPILADFDADGSTDIAVTTGDGNIRLLAASEP